jgi:tetratricopeptide (TPR) repeat protein
VRRPAYAWLILGLVIACAEPEVPPAVAERPIETNPCRQRVLDFWRIYREATQMRVDGEVSASLTRYDSALVINPDHGDALYYSGSAAFQQGQYADAETRWRRLLRNDSSNARAHAQLGMLYSCGLPGAPVDLPRARHELEQALALNRAETGPQVRLGEVALLQGDLAAAAGYLNAARQTNQRAVAAHYLSGYLHWQAGHFDRASSALSDAITAIGGGTAEASASAEGQTRRGFRPLLESGHDGPLAVHWQRLAGGFGPVTAATTQSEYERLQQVIDTQREEFSQRPRTGEEDR